MMKHALVSSTSDRLRRIKNRVILMAGILILLEVMGLVIKAVNEAESSILATVAVSLPSFIVFVGVCTKDTPVVKKGIFAIEALIALLIIVVVLALFGLDELTVVTVTDIFSYLRLGVMFVLYSFIRSNLKQYVTLAESNNAI